MSDDQMARDHAADYAAKRVFDTAASAIDAVVADERAALRLGPGWCDAARDLADELKQRSDHVVAVWD